MKKPAMRTLAVAALPAVIASASAQSITLTGINWYTLNSAGSYTGGYANTYGGDTYSRNLYATVNQPVGAGPLINSQNLTTLPTRVQVNLSSPGVYNFVLYCNDESTSANPFWGLNLFFDGNDLRPGISVKNVVDANGFQSIDAIATPTLDPLSMGLVQQHAGSGTGSQPVFSADGFQIKLTAYNTWDASHYNVDRVDNFTDDSGLGNGTKDDVIEFTLQSTPVPEPCSLVFLGGTSLVMILRRRARGTRN